MDNYTQISTIIPDIPVQFRLQNEAIKAAIDFKREHDPVFSSLTLGDLADKCHIGRSTFKRIVNGATTDANCSTVALICEGLGIDPAVVMGLAPIIDYKREEEEYNPTLMDTMRRQNIALEERLTEKCSRIEELTQELDKSEVECHRLRLLYNDTCKSLSAAETIARDSESDKNELKRLRRLNNMLLTVLVAVAVVLLMIYVVWELRNPDQGFTELLRRLLM